MVPSSHHQPILHHWSTIGLPLILQRLEFTMSQPSLLHFKIKQWSITNNQPQVHVYDEPTVNPPWIKHEPTSLITSTIKDGPSNLLHWCGQDSESRCLLRRPWLAVLSLALDNSSWKTVTIKSIKKELKEVVDQLSSCRLMDWHRKSLWLSAQAAFGSFIRHGCDYWLLGDGISMTVPVGDGKNWLIVTKWW